MSDKEITGEEVQREVEWLLSQGVSKKEAIIIAGTHILLKKMGFIDAPRGCTDDHNKGS